jgi:hypothetical protein
LAAKSGSDYARRIATAIDAGTPEDSVEQIKAAVADELQQIDRRARVVSTQYFNHSYSPDLVLAWPHNGAAADRPVFLRFNSDPRVVIEDMGIIGERRPIIFGLESDTETLDQAGVEPADLALSDRAREHQTLLTDANGLETFITRRGDAPVVGLAAAAIVQGGKGLMDESAASEVAGDVERGFAGAQALDADSTLRAAQTFERTLDLVHSRRMIRFLQAVWLGSGGRTDEFPASAELGGLLTDEGLEYLLGAGEIDDADFWHRLGRSLSTDQLGRLHVEGRPPNLQHLVRQNLDVLTAKIARVLADEPRIDGEDLETYWVIERGMLALRGVDFTAYLASVLDQMTVLRPESDGLSLETLLARAERHRLVVGRLRLTRGDRHVEYGSETSADVIHDEELHALNATFGPSARVHHAVATLAGGGELQFNFRTNTASGRTASKFPVAELLRTTLGLLKDFSAQQLTEMLPRPVDDGQTSLDLGL